MSIGLGKTDNEYAQQVRDIEASKAVWMAIAYSLANRITCDAPIAARDLCLSEWQALHDNDIVPQKPRVGR